VESAFRELTSRLGRLADTMLLLRVTAIEERPRSGGAIIRLADAYDDTVEEALGWSEDAFEAAVEGRNATEHALDLERARLAMAACHERYNTLLSHFLSTLASEGELARLARLGGEHGESWPAWVDMLRQAIDSCWGPLLDAGRTIASCREELRMAAIAPARLADTLYHRPVEKLPDYHQTC
jgi:hypothetical protein